jgi:hypothetical protein
MILTIVWSLVFSGIEAYFFITLSGVGLSTLGTAAITGLLYHQRPITIKLFLCGLVVRVPGYRSRGPGFDSRRYQIFWEVVGLERGPLMSTNEELLGRNSSGYGLENRVYGRGDPLRWHTTPSICKSWH